MACIRPQLAHGWEAVAAGPQYRRGHHGWKFIAFGPGLLAAPVAQHYVRLGWLAQLPLSRHKARAPALQTFMDCLRLAAAEHGEGTAAATPSGAQT